MATRKLSLAVIRRTVSTLPGVEEGTSYGTPAWRHKGKLLARLHQDGRSIVLKVGNETRDHLLQADPATFFVTDHYSRLSDGAGAPRPAECCGPEEAAGAGDRDEDKVMVSSRAQRGTFEATSKVPRYARDDSGGVSNAVRPLSTLMLLSLTTLVQRSVSNFSFSR